jgi:hypothetical protein
VRPVDGNGLRVDTLGLSEFWLSTVSQYKFERVSRTEVKRILLSDMSEEVLSNTPNGNGERIDVKAYVERRIAHAKRSNAGGKALFGTPGREVWYGGRTDVSRPNLTTVWAEIERVTPNRQRDFTSYPNLNRKKHLVLQTDDFTSARGALLTQPEYDNTDPENPILVRKRARFVDIDATLTAPERTSARDPAQETDITREFTEATIVSTR